jgi:hypothetical protein
MHRSRHDVAVIGPNAKRKVPPVNGLTGGT